MQAGGPADYAQLKKEMMSAGLAAVGGDAQAAARLDSFVRAMAAAHGEDVASERKTLEAVTQARSQAMRSGADIATRAVAEMALGGAVGNLFAVAEKYPTLKASQNFLLLQEQLTSTENRIAFARQHYNERVRSSILRSRNSRGTSWPARSGSLRRSCSRRRRQIGRT